MTKAKYKSVRLLIQAVNETMGEVRKVAMGNVGLPWPALNDLRDLVEQLAEKAERIAVEDVNLDSMSPGDYVATMKPLISVFHRQLMEANHLAPVLCADLRANACVLILVGEGNTVVRTAHDPSRPEITLAVEAILAALDSGTKKVAEEGIAAVEAAQPVELCSGCDCEAGACDCEGCEGRSPRFGGSPDEEQPERVQLLEEAERPGWDSSEGEALRAQVKGLVSEDERTP